VPDQVSWLFGVPCLVCAADGPLVATERDALDLIGDGGARGATLVVLPVERLAGAFFQLRTGLAGQVAQKFVQYEMRLAILGDVTGQLERSETFASFAYETNRGTQLWFVNDIDELSERLGGAAR
jgi:hypothetical protein